MRNSSKARRWSEPYDPTPPQDRRSSWRSLSSQKRGSQGQIHAAQRADPGLNPADARANAPAAPADVPNGQTRAVSKDPKIANLQHEIDETIGVMSKNIEGMAERGERLQDLQHKTDNLSIASQTFRKKAGDVRRQMWWKNMKWWFIIIAVLLLFVICGIIGALKGKEVVHVINDAAQPSAGGVDSNPAVGLHDQPHNAAESASASPAASAVSPGGSVAGFPIFGGTADFGPGVPPPGYSPVSVDRRKREPANEDRHVDTPEPHEHPVLGETEQEQEEDQVQQQGVHIVNERDEAIDGEDAQGREARSRDDIDVKTSAHGVQDRDVQKHAPPSEGDLHQRAVHPETDSSANGETEKDKRSGFIGIEHIGTPSSSTVGSKRRRRNHHVGDEAGISSDPTPSPGRVEANDAKTEAVMKPNATSKGPLKPRSTPKKPACLRRRGRGKKRRGRALGGKFGRRGAEGKKWFISR